MRAIFLFPLKNMKRKVHLDENPPYFKNVYINYILNKTRNKS